MTYQCGFSPSEWSAPVTDLYPHSAIQQPGSVFVTLILEHVLRTEDRTSVPSRCKRGESCSSRRSNRNFSTREIQNTMSEQNE